MKAMIMAAGVGSRLMPLTMKIPKPMVPMANRPLMEYILELLAQHGFTGLIANLHYHAPVISGHFGDGSRFGVWLQYSREEELLGTAGGVKNCQWFLDETFAVVSGDALTDINLTRLLEEHRRKGALATIALKDVEDVEQFGIVVTGEDGQIRRFQEKPHPAEALGHQANTGIYIFEPEIFRYIPAGQFYDFGKQVFPHLVHLGAPFYGVSIDDYWCDVGNLITYHQAHTDFLQGKVRLTPGGEMRAGERSRVLVAEGSTIAADVLLEGNVVVGPDCRIENGACLRDAVLWDQCLVGPHSRVYESILGSSCRLGESVQLNRGTVLASGCLLANGLETPAGSRVYSTIGSEMQLEQS